jgi:hypothetical protein
MLSISGWRQSLAVPVTESPGTVWPNAGDAVTAIAALTTAAARTDLDGDHRMYRVLHPRGGNVKPVLVEPYSCSDTTAPDGT